MNIEAVILTGGASRRMGSDKAQLMVMGESVALRTSRELDCQCGKVTVLGRVPMPPYPFLLDQQEFAGPLMALAQFEPEARTVFLASCDMPRFAGQIVPFLHTLIGDGQAVVPVVGDRRQPLCALYSAEAWENLPKLVSSGCRSMMGWLETLSCRFVSEKEVIEAGIDPLSIQGANSAEEWERLSPK